MRNALHDCGGKTAMLLAKGGGEENEETETDERVHSRALSRSSAEVISIQTVVTAGK